MDLGYVRWVKKVTGKFLLQLAGSTSEPISRGPYSPGGGNGSSAAAAAAAAVAAGEWVSGGGHEVTDNKPDSLCRT